MRLLCSPAVHVLDGVSSPAVHVLDGVNLCLLCVVVPLMHVSDSIVRWCGGT